MTTKERDPAIDRASQSFKAGKLDDCEYSGKYAPNQVLSGSSSQETANDYRHIIAEHGAWRVIRCRDDAQFIVQYKAGQARARPWEARGFVVSRKMLGPVLERRSLGIPTTALAVLLDQLWEVSV